VKLSEKLNKRINHPQFVTLARFKRLEAAIEAIMNRWPDIVAEPPENDREIIVSAIIDRLKNDAWSGTSTSLVVAAARALFDEHRRERPDLSDLREFYYQETQVSTRSSFLGAMFSVYLGSYSPDAIHTKKLALALSAAQANLGSRWHQLINNIPQILDPQKAHESIGQLMVDMDVPWIQLQKLGIRTPHAPGLMDYAHLYFIKKCSPQLKNRIAITKMFEWLKPPKQLQAKSFAAGEAISAILKHWEQSTPNQKFITFLTENLVDLYGDPRLNPGGAWPNVPDNLLNVFIRWLTGEDIRFFIDVVSAVEVNTRDGHMWEPRRDFWLKLYQQKRIQNAWVAFSNDAATYAKRLRNRTNNNLAEFGYQIAGGPRKETSLLILEIGNKIIIEGSHNYKVRIFNKDNINTPKLFKPKYDCDYIVGLTPIAAFRHDQNGKWKNHVEEYI
jgi:hypothetical protein